MDGPSHFRNAEEWLTEAERWLRNSDDDLTVSGVRAAADLAQVHATLALAAEKRKPLVMLIEGGITPAELEHVTEAIRAAYDHVDGVGA